MMSLCTCYLGVTAVCRQSPPSEIMPHAHISYDAIDKVQESLEILLTDAA